MIRAAVGTAVTHAPSLASAWCRATAACCGKTRKRRQRCRHGSAKRTSISTPVNSSARGFRGPLNYYRNVDRNWELMAAFAGMKVTVPALYVAGDHDMVVAFPGMDQHLTNMKNFVPALRKIKMLPGCGHWTQQERPGEVNAAIIEFLRSLPD